MATESVGRFTRLFLIVLTSLAIVVSLNLNGNFLPAASVSAQGQQLRLGDMRADWFCLQRGYSAWVTNNGTDWACSAADGTLVLLLGQNEFNAACQGFYRTAAAYAIRDRNTSSPALDWSCYVNIVPTHTPIPTFTPTPRQATRLGDFQVEWYCNERQLGVRTVNNDTDWACIQPNSTQIVFILNQNDFNAICRRTYSLVNAYAVQDQNKPQPIYNWSCYVDVAQAPPQAAPTIAPRLTRVGDFQVEWYCRERGLDVRVINVQADWACTAPNSDQVVFILAQPDFDRICQTIYHEPTAFALRDQNKPQPAYNWSCYIYW